MVSLRESDKWITNDFLFGFGWFNPFISTNARAYLFSLIYKIEKSQVDPNFLYRSRSFQILRNENV